MSGADEGAGPTLIPTYPRRRGQAWEPYRSHRPSKGHITPGYKCERCETQDNRLFPDPIHADRLLGNRFFGPCFLEAEEPGKVGVQCNWLEFRNMLDSLLMSGNNIQIVLERRTGRKVMVTCVQFLAHAE